MESRRNGPQLSSRHDDDDDCVGGYFSTEHSVMSVILLLIITTCLQLLLIPAFQSYKSGPQYLINSYNERLDFSANYLGGNQTAQN